jgi:hypothetical protein
MLRVILCEGHAEPKIYFSVIGINHNHIYSQVDSVIRGGGQLVSFYAKEDDLAAAFSKNIRRQKKQLMKKRYWKISPSS